MKSLQTTFSIEVATILEYPSSFDRVCDCLVLTGCSILTFLVDLCGKTSHRMCISRLICGRLPGGKLAYLYKLVITSTLWSIGFTWCYNEHRDFCQVSRDFSRWIFEQVNTAKHRRRYEKIWTTGRTVRSFSFWSSSSMWHTHCI